jgi:hypothetical protein
VPKQRALQALLSLLSRADSVCQPACAWLQMLCGQSTRTRLALLDAGAADAAAALARRGSAATAAAAVRVLCAFAAGVQGATAALDAGALPLLAQQLSRGRRDEWAPLLDLARKLFAAASDFERADGEANDDGDGIVAVLRALLPVTSAASNNVLADVLACIAEVDVEVLPLEVAIALALHCGPSLAFAAGRVRAYGEADLEAASTDATVTACGALHRVLQALHRAGPEQRSCNADELSYMCSIAEQMGEKALLLLHDVSTSAYSEDAMVQCLGLLHMLVLEHAAANGARQVAAGGAVPGGAPRSESSSGSVISSDVSSGESETSGSSSGWQSDDVPMPRSPGSTASAARSVRLFVSRSPSEDLAAFTAEMQRNTMPGLASWEPDTPASTCSSASSAQSLEILAMRSPSADLAAFTATLQAGAACESASVSTSSGSGGCEGASTAVSTPLLQAGCSQHPASLNMQSAADAELCSACAAPQAAAADGLVQFDDEDAGERASAGQHENASAAVLAGPELTGEKRAASVKSCLRGCSTRPACHRRFRDVVVSKSLWVRAHNKHQCVQVTLERESCLPLDPRQPAPLPQHTQAASPIAKQRQGEPTAACPLACLAPSWTGWRTRRASRSSWRCCAATS